MKFFKTDEEQLDFHESDKPNLFLWLFHDFLSTTTNSLEIEFCLFFIIHDY